jgi:hypothetical protein
MVLTAHKTFGNLTKQMILLDIGNITGQTEDLYPMNLKTKLLSAIEVYTISDKEYKYS